MVTLCHDWLGVEQIRQGAYTYKELLKKWKKGKGVSPFMASQLTLHPSKIPLKDLYNILKPITVGPSAPRARFSNWAQTYHCTPLAVFEPETEYQCELILELARREGKKVKAVGIGHSPSDLACTTEFMLRTEKLNKVIDINSEKGYFTAQGGITLSKLHEELARHNLAMICIGSISDQTLAGVVTTASHGSGIHFGVMSTTEHPDLFLATICGLGATGIILTVQMEVEPAFRLKEIQESVPFDAVINEFDCLTTSAQHVRYWWYPSSDVVRCYYSNRTREPKTSAVPGWRTFFVDHIIQLLLFLGRFFSSLNALAASLTCWFTQGRVICIDDSYRLFNLDVKLSHYTSEWAIPYENSTACLRELDCWLKQEHMDPHGLRPHFPIEIRFTSADDIWLSPSHGRRTCWIGLLQYRPYGYNVPYREYFRRFEAIVTRYQGRPHWAKAHSLHPVELRKLYPKFDNFVGLIEKIDPQGIFRNEYIERHIFGKPVSERAFMLRH